MQCSARETGCCLFAILGPTLAAGQPTRHFFLVRRSAATPFLYSGQSRRGAHVRIPRFAYPCLRPFAVNSIKLSRVRLPARTQPRGVFNRFRGSSGGEGPPNPPFVDQNPGLDGLGGQPPGSPGGGGGALRTTDPKMVVWNNGFCGRRRRRRCFFRQGGIFWFYPMCLY